MRANIKAIKGIMEEWAAVLDIAYHHFEDTIKPGLPANEPFVNATKLSYYEIVSNPIEVYFVKKICETLKISFEEYLQYRNLLMHLDEHSKGKRKG
jgi:hypothetical protein